MAGEQRIDYTFRLACPATASGTVGMVDEGLTQALQDVSEELDGCEFDLLLTKTPRGYVAVCASSTLAREAAIVAQSERAKGHEVRLPEYTGVGQPTDEQVEAWHDVVINADEVVAVVGDDYGIGDHVRAELAAAHMCGIPVRLVNGELEAK